MKAHPSSAGTKNGASDHWGMEASWPLVSAQKDAKNECKPPEGIERWGSTRSGEEGAQRTGGKDTSDLRRKYHQEQQGSGFWSRLAGEGSALSQWQRKYGT